MSEIEHTKNLRSSKKWSYWHSIGTEPLFYKTLGQCVDEAAEKFGDREAFVSIHEGVRFSFKNIRDQSDKLAAGLYAIGLRPGDRLGIWMPNYSQWYLTMMAAAKAGLILVGLNPAFQVLDLEYCLKKVEIKCIITQRQFKTQQFYDILVKLIPELNYCEPGKFKSAKFPHLTTVVVVDDGQLKGCYKFQDIFSIVSPESVQEISKLKETIHPDLPLNVQFTSGTTGQPKAACLSHFSFVNNSYQTGKIYKIGSKLNKICVAVPFFHAYGIASIICTLMHGTILVVPGPIYSAVLCLEAIVKERCTITHGTPTMYVDMISTQKKMQYPLDSWEVAVTAGAPCSPSLVKQMIDDLKINEVMAAYGLTESTAVILQTLPGDGVDKLTDTVGYVQDHLEVKIVDGKGYVVPFGQPGELCVRGYTTMLGYWKDEEKTMEIYGKDKWLKTGDQFILRGDGYGCVVERYKEMIIRGGENIFPKEIEDFLNTHPDIIEANVVGVPNERLGEEVCAFIRVEEGKKVDREKVKQFYKDKIAYFKIPEFVIQIDAFPKTASGKVQKFKLQEMFTKFYKEEEK